MSARKNFGAKPYLFPQPVLIIGTYDENGKANAMNAAWGGIVGADEIMIDLSHHKTTENLMKTKAFTVSAADAEHMVACDYVGIVSGSTEPNKMEKAGFTTTKSEFVNAPIINELPVTLECELVDVIDGSKYLGRIKNVSVDERVLRRWRNQPGSLLPDYLRHSTSWILQAWGTGRKCLPGRRKAEVIRAPGIQNDSVHSKKEAK